MRLPSPVPSPSSPARPLSSPVRSSSPPSSTNVSIDDETTTEAAVPEIEVVSAFAE